MAVAAEAAFISRHGVNRRELRSCRATRFFAAWTFLTALLLGQTAAESNATSMTATTVASLTTLTTTSTDLTSTSTTKTFASTTTGTVRLSTTTGSVSTSTATAGPTMVIGKVAFSVELPENTTALDFVKDMNVKQAVARSIAAKLVVPVAWVDVALTVASRRLSVSRQLAAAPVIHIDFTIAVPHTATPSKSASIQTSLKSALSQIEKDAWSSSLKTSIAAASPTYAALKVTVVSVTDTGASVNALCTLNAWEPSKDAMGILVRSWHSSNCIGSSCTAKKVLKIGTPITLDLSTKYGSISRSVRQAYLLYFEWLNSLHGGVSINGEKYFVELVLLDDKSSKARVAQITDYLIDKQNIKHFLAPYSSGLTGVMAKKVQEKGLVQVAPCAASTSVFKDRPNVFGTLNRAPMFLEHVFEKLQYFAKSVTYVYEDLGFSRGVCGAANVLAADRGMKVVFGSVTQKQGSLSSDANQTEVDKMIGAVAGYKADLFIACVYDNVCRRILSSAKKQQFNPKAAVFTICVAKDDFLTDVGDVGMLVLGVAPWTRQVKVTSALGDHLTSTEFRDMYEEQYYTIVPYQATSAFAAAATLVYGIETAGTLDPGKIADVIRNMNNDSVFGKISFDENGQGKTSIKVVQVQGNETPVVAPLESASATLVYPKPSFDALACLNQDEFNVGRHGIALNGSCLECTSIEVAPYNSTTGFRTCQKLVCAPGKRSVIFGAQGKMIGGAYCANCTAGFHAATKGHTQCKSCAVGAYQNQMSSKKCKLCEPGRFATSEGSTQCETCVAGRYSSTYGSSECMGCPLGSTCRKNSNGLLTDFVNADGWFLLDSGDGTHDLIKCKHGVDGSACLEGNKCHVDEDTGEPSMEGIFCGRCRPDYGRLGASRICRKCPGLGVLLVLCSLQMAILMSVAVVIFFLVVWTDLTKPKNISAIILKQFFNYLGMTSVVFGATNFNIPIRFGYLSDATDYFKNAFGASSPLWAAHAGECLAERFAPAYKMYVLGGALWVPLWIIFLCICFRIVQCIQERRHKKVNKHRLMTLLIINLFVIHPRVSQLCLSVFLCGHFDKPRLMMDTTVDCQSHTHANWQLLGLAGFAVYSCGIPFGTFLLLRHYKKNDKLHKKKTINTLGFLYSGFEPQHYYFESVFMFRKVLYQLIVLIPPLATSVPDDDALIKLISLMVLAVVFLAIHMRCEPYDNRAYFTLDRLEACSLWAILATVLVQSWVFVSDKAYAFNFAENGDAGMTKQNKDIRDLVAVIIVFIFHARYFLLTIYLMGRPMILSITRWRCLDHGFVLVLEDGLELSHCDAMGEQLFTSMFQELTELLIDQRKAVTYEELIVSLKFMCVNCSYHRKREQLEKGILFDPDDRGHSSILESLHGEGLRNMMARASLAFSKHVTARVNSLAHQATDLANQATNIDGEGCSRSRSPSSAKLDLFDLDHALAMKELDKLKLFNSETVARCVGERFSIEELHLALVRVGKEMGRGAQLRVESVKTKGNRKTMKAAASGGGGRGRVSYKISMGEGGDGDGTINCLEGWSPEDEEEPPDLAEDENVAEIKALETELRATKAELLNLHTTHTVALSNYAYRMNEQDEQRKALLLRIKENWKTPQDWDAEDMDDDDDGGLQDDSLAREGSGARDIADAQLQKSTRKTISMISHSGDYPCKNCGNLLMLDAKFCRKCGLQRGESKMSAASPPQQNVDSTSKLSATSTPRQNVGSTAKPQKEIVAESGEGVAEIVTVSERGRKAPEDVPDDAAGLQKQLAKEAEEDQLYLLKFEIDLSARTILARDAELAAEKAKVAALQSQLQAFLAGKPAKAASGDQMPLELAEGDHPDATSRHAYQI